MWAAWNRLHIWVVNICVDIQSGTARHVDCNDAAGSLASSLDLQVTREQIFTDLATPKFEWDHPGRSKQPQKTDAVTVSDDPYEACNDAHGLAVLTEWDEFKKYDYERIYNTMMKPAFIFDGRNLLDHDKLREIGFIVYALGKPLDPFIQKAYS